MVYSVVCTACDSTCVGYSCRSGCRSDRREDWRGRREGKRGIRGSIRSNNSGNKGDNSDTDNSLNDMDAEVNRIKESVYISEVGGGGRLRIEYKGEVIAVREGDKELEVHE